MYPDVVENDVVTGHYLRLEKSLLGCYLLLYRWIVLYLTIDMYVCIREQASPTT